jgi:TonB family protein
MRWVWAVYFSLAATQVLAQASAPAAAPAHTAPFGAKDFQFAYWIRAPHGDDLHAAWPVKALERGEGGTATVTCTVNIDGTTSNCKIISETPPGDGFGGAALLLTPSFLFHPATRNGQPVQSQVTVPLKFENPAGGPHLIVETVSVLSWAPWETAPTVADLQAAYPAKALAAGKNGHVVLRCAFDPRGGLKDCETITVQPQWLGFEPAARSLVKMFRMKAPDADRKTIDKYRVNLAIQFNPPPVSGIRYINEPNWTRRIDPNHPQAIFPAAAASAGLNKGTGVVDCAVTSGGALSQCRAISETQPGMPTVGARIKAPFTFVDSTKDETPATP